jgi:hypothetical protein
LFGLPFTTVPVPSTLPSLIHLDRIAVTQNLPTVLGIGEVLETHLVSVDVPVADVVLAPDPAVRLVKFRIGPRRYHRTLHRIADKECAYLFSREQFGRTCNNGDDQNYAR